MEATQGWFFQTKEGRSFLVIRDGPGIYCGLRSAVNSSDFFGKDITDLKGSERDLINQINENDEVFFTDLEFREEVHNWHNIKLLEKFTLENKDKKILFKHDELRFMIEREYVF